MMKELKNQIPIDRNELFLHYWHFVEENKTLYRGYPHKSPVTLCFDVFFENVPEKTVGPTVELRVIIDAMMVMRITVRDIDVMNH